MKLYLPHGHCIEDIIAFSPRCCLQQGRRLEKSLLQAEFFLVYAYFLLPFLDDSTEYQVWHFVLIFDKELTHCLLVYSPVFFRLFIDYSPSCFLHASSVTGLLWM